MITHNKSENATDPSEHTLLNVARYQDFACISDKKMLFLFYFAAALIFCLRCLFTFDLSMNLYKLIHQNSEISLCPDVCMYQGMQMLQAQINA